VPVPGLLSAFHSAEAGLQDSGEILGLAISVAVVGFTQQDTGEVFRATPGGAEVADNAGVVG